MKRFFLMMVVAAFVGVMSVGCGDDATESTTTTDETTTTTTSSGGEGDLGTGTDAPGGDAPADAPGGDAPAEGM